MPQLDFTQLMIAALAYVGLLIITVVGLRWDQKASKEAGVKRDLVVDKALATIDSDAKEAAKTRAAVVDKALASIEADITVLFKHMNRAEIHQESMSVRELQTNFQAIKVGQETLAGQVKDHITDDRREMHELRQELVIIRETQATGFKDLLEKFDDLRDRLPVRVPLPRPSIDD